MPPIIDASETFTATDGNVYHVDDPFHWDNTNGFPQLPPGTSRWHYYVAQVMSTYYQNPVNAYNTYITTGVMPPDGDLLKAKGAFTDADSLIPPLTEDVLNNNDPLDPTTYADDILHDRGEYGFPQCATDPDEGGLDAENFSLDPRRLVVVAAIVDCVKEEVSGKSKNVQATYFVETFISQPVKGDPVEKEKFDMYIEIIGPPLNSGVATIDNGVFRNLVQIYR